MQDQMLRCKLGDKGKFQMSIVDNRKAKRDARALDKKADIVEEVFEDDSEVMEDINQSKSESEESKGDTSAEYEDDAVKRF